MKKPFTPNEKKRITITFGNLTATFEGMSIEEIFSVLEKFRETFPNLYSRAEKLSRPNPREAKRQAKRAARVRNEQGYIESLGGNIPQQTSNIPISDEYEG